MTKYTDKQIIEAIKKAGGKKHPGTVYAWELSMYKEVLDALPGPDSEWEQVNEISQLRRGDMLKVVADNVTRIYRYAVKKVDERDVIFDNGTVILIDFTHNAIYRIPAPVQHPDPAEHPVIVNVAVDKPGTNSTHRYDYATWDAEEYYDCWGNDGKYYGGWQPSTITEWSPGKVVEDDR